MSKKCIEIPICEKILEKYGQLNLHFINHGFVFSDEIKKYHNNDEYYLQYRYHCNLFRKVLYNTKTYFSIERKYIRD